MAVNVPRFSRLRFAELVLVDDFEFWDVVDLPEILEQPDDLIYTITDADRIDLLAFRFYRDARLWWVIAVANDLELIPAELNTGDELRIPSRRFVTQILFNTSSLRGRGRTSG